MGTYIVRRLLQAIPMLLLVSIVLFALVNIALMRSRYHPVRESCSDGSRAGGLQSARRRWTAPTSARRFCGLFSWAGKS